MKKLAFLFIGFCVLANAQEIPFTIAKSELFKDEYRNSKIAFAEKDGKGGIFIVRSYEAGGVSAKSGYYFEQYDSNLKLVKSQEYDMADSNIKKHNIVLGFFNSGSAIQVVEMYYEIVEKSYICMAHSISLEDFKVSRTELFRLTREQISQYGSFSLRQLFEWRSMHADYGNAKSNMWHSDYWNSMFSNKTDVADADDRSSISMAVNKDKTAFVIGLDLNGKEAEIMKLYLFDSNLGKKAEHTFSSEVKDKEFKYQTIDISNDGSEMYLLGKAFDNQSNKKELGGKYQYVLTKFTKDTQKTMVFDSGERYVTSLQTVFNGDKLACIGFYSDKRDNQYGGICYFDIDLTSLEVRKSKFNAFSDQFLIDKYGEGKHKDLKHLVFRDILVTEQGEIMLNAEENYISSTGNGYATGVPGSVNSMYGMQMPSSTRTIFFNCDDIVSAKIDTQGELVWVRNINKLQSRKADDDNYISYTSTVKSDNTYFFINAADKIKKLSSDRIQFGDVKTKKSNLNIIRVKANGDFDYQEILDDEQNEVPFMVSKGVTINDATYFLGRKGKIKQLLKVTL